MAPRPICKRIRLLSLILLFFIGVFPTEKARGGTVYFEENFDGLSLKPAQDESIPANILGWTHTPPSGWSIDNSNMPPVKGVTEWQGWSFTTLNFWTSADGQERSNFSLSSNIFAVADCDEWDDKNNPSSSGDFNSVLVSPPINLPAGKTTYLHFDSHYRQEGDQKAEVRVAFNGGAEQVILQYSSNSSSANNGSDAQNREIVIEIPPHPEDSSMVIKWALFDAGNNWFWAIDNISLNEEPPEPPPDPLPLPDVKDWPTYMHDNMRSGVTPDSLNLEDMNLLWTYSKALPPRPAWPGPAKWDAWAMIIGLKNMRNYDPVYHVTSVGGSVFFGSSTEDCVRCLDAQTGKEDWIFFANGPVRLPPTYYDEKVYFGSDDGYVYCLKASTGEIVWKYKASPDDRMVPSDGKLISLWPVRTGVLVQDGKAYFAASLLPWKSANLFAVDALTGSNTGDGLFKVSRTGSVTMEGSLLSSPTRLYVPQGRREPLVFNRLNGSYNGKISAGGGGVFCLLTTDYAFAHGPGNKGGWITESDAETHDTIATINGGNLMIVSGNVSYIQKDTNLMALDRQSRQTIWSVPCSFKNALIMAGDDLVLGGNGKVGAFSSDTGKMIWTHEVEGKAYGLAVVDTTLFVSTDTGKIYAFGKSAPGGMQLPGDANQDGSLDISDAITFLQFLFSEHPNEYPCGGDVLEEGGNLELLDLNSDDHIDLADCIYLLSYLFANGQEPVLGTGCVPIEGCSDSCTN